MAETYGPFDGSGTVWTQAQWFDFAPLWTPSGVVGPVASAVGSGDLPLTVNGLTASVGTGRAWVRGAGYKNDTLKAFSVTANTNASLSRRDRIALRRDTAAKTVTAIRLAGTPAASPAAPALTQVDGGVWDLPMFSFLVPPNSGTTLSGFVDERAWLSPGGGSDPAYASSAARDAHIPSPGEGQVSWLADTNVAEVYDSGGWRSIGPLFKGSFSGATGSTGNVDIVHGMTAVPSVIFIQLKNSAGPVAIMNHVVTAKTSSAFTVVFSNSNTGAAINGNPVDFDWFALR